MGNIRKRGDKFHAIVRKKGYPAMSANFDDEETAKKWIQQTEDNINIERAYKKTEKITHRLNLFSDLVARYIKEHLPKVTDRNHRETQLKFWLEEFQGKFVEDITPEMIKQSLKNLSKKISLKNKKPYSPSTIKRYAACLSHFFTIALSKWGIVKNHPCQMIYSGNRIGIFGNSTKKKNVWISVEDRLPDEDTQVLTCNSDLGWMEVGSYSPHNKPDHPDEPTGWETCSAFLFEYDVTHWMELPELPELSTEDYEDQ